MVFIIQLQVAIPQKELSRHPHKIRPNPTQRRQRIDESHEVSAVEIGGDSEDTEADHAEVDCE